MRAENLAGTEPLPGRDAADLVGESKIQRPVAEPVNVPPLRYRTLIVRMCTGAVYVAINVLAILSSFPRLSSWRRPPVSAVGSSSA